LIYQVFPAFYIPD